MVRWRQIFKVSKDFEHLGLNGRSILDIKNNISRKFGYDVSDIKLFGSRIFGDYRNDSDLDVVILDPVKLGQPHIKIRLLGFDMDISFIDSFDYSWLIDSV
ncbi:MAG: nucleotidyltransferase domain-containing protein [Synergistaceae bacterium]|jgi:hypothetical protein|nr:nucleotidyltransferase domain-containing protein [Synergistaceae bacterium]